jgi:hypothetical protein
VKFEVLTAVTVKVTVFEDIMPYSPISITDVSEECSAFIFRVFLSCPEDCDSMSLLNVCETCTTAAGGGKFTMNVL